MKQKKLNILAINTSASSGSIALSKNGVITFITYLDVRVTHSERLLKQIDLGLQQCNLQVKDLDLICVAIGPGSFTGIRIGLATAKGLSYAHRIPLLPIDNLALLAHNLQSVELPRLVLIDARMNEVYAALYDKDDNVVIPPQNCRPQEICAELTERVLLIGDGVEKYWNEIEESGIDYRLANIQQNLDLASCLISLAWHRENLPEYDFELVSQLEPLYLRKSQAEIEKAKREQKINKKGSNYAK